MVNIKKIHPVFLPILVGVVSVIVGYLGTSYISAQSQPIYYCKSQTASNIRYFGCSTDSSFSVLPNNGASSCEISADDLACQTRTVSTAINSFLGNYYCPQGWSYYPSSPSSNFKCSAPVGVFDFLLSNGGDKSVSPGQTVTNTATVTLTSGNAQGVRFSASGLPSNASSSFSPASCTPSGSGTMICTTTMTITTSPSTPLGVFPVTVTGVSTIQLQNQSPTAICYGEPIMGHFQAKITINNGDDKPAVFNLIPSSLVKVYQETAPATFTVPANSTLTQGGFGYIPTVYNCDLTKTPNSPYAGNGGSARYNVSINGVTVGTVTYSWTYPI